MVQLYFYFVSLKKSYLLFSGVFGVLVFVGGVVPGVLDVVLHHPVLRGGGRVGAAGGRSRPVGFARGRFRPVGVARGQLRPPTRPNAPPASSAAPRQPLLAPRMQFIQTWID